MSKNESGEAKKQPSLTKRISGSLAKIPSLSRRGSNKDLADRVQGNSSGEPIPPVPSLPDAAAHVVSQASDNKPAPSRKRSFPRISLSRKASKSNVAAEAPSASDIPPPVPSRTAAQRPPVTSKPPAIEKPLAAGSESLQTKIKTFKELEAEVAASRPVNNMGPTAVGLNPLFQLWFYPC